MCTMTKKYERFGRLMVCDEVYRNPFLDYRDICRMVGVSPSALDRLLISELGMDGEEILGRYRELTLDIAPKNY